jgi:PIN domain nuclease of toxin-antitoxin system
MARLIYLDTHVVAWLHGLGPESLSQRAVELIEGAGRSALLADGPARAAVSA